MSSLFNLFGAPSEEAQEQQPRRPATRSQSQSRAPHLDIPSNAISNFNGVARGRRSPSPSLVGHNANSKIIFAYDSTNVSERILQSQEQPVDVGTFDNADDSIAAAAAAEMSMTSIEELRANAAAAIEAANAATQALVAATGLVTQQSQQQQQVRVRKPELPDFDSRNVEIWIKRVQAAYDRAGITQAKDKFAFLETKFAVGANPSVDEFLYGPANDETWNSFLAYIRSEYGRTVRQEAQYIRGQFSRDGRRPTQMLAHIKDKVKRVSVDDILKEIIVSSLPSDVQQMIQERVKDLSADQTASLADKYFDQEGKPLHSRPSSIHSVDSSQQDVRDDDDEEADVNAIGGKRGNFRPRSRNSNNNNNNARFTKPFFDNGQPQRNNNNNRQSNRGLLNPRSSFNGAQSAAPSNSSSTSNAAASSSKTPILCMSHQRYGDKTYSCQQGCSLWPEFQKRQAGKANAGKRW